MSQFKPQQLTLDLPVRSAFGRDDFLVSESNAEAVAWIDRWPDWPSGVVIVQGPPGSGKTHLATVWTSRSGAHRHERGDLSQCMDAAGQGRSLCLDINGQINDEAALFHLLNWAREHRADILMTSHKPPQQLEFTLPDLASRIRASQVISLQEPDDALMGAVLVKLFHDRQISVTQDMISYLVPRLERTFSALNEAVDRLDKAAMEAGRAVTIPLAGRVLNL